MVSVGHAAAKKDSSHQPSVQVPKASLALRALSDREALREVLRRAAGKLRDVQAACAGLADVIEEVESALDASA